ncbi:WXG100-like domain-containing protein [Streptosporangium sp. NBC_01756]|uniref:WXG100-like domain-containing protein n=1 Tax=Streptosporangium sp. NBC_01756 TaxID=2975950 RepID=UPI002DD8BB35|nr:hypothetical protein [Streptosporangium sp. NBC_01756]WSC84324.1 hypothetical protein OIE48_28590 [Streptosporangium sp. NBC_01756]
MAVTLPAELKASFGLLGVEWPKEDEDHLHACGAALHACATALEGEVNPTANGAVAHASAKNSGDHIDELNDHWTDYQGDDQQTGHLQNLATSLHALADGHNLFAKVITVVKLLLKLLATYALLAVAWAMTTALISGGLAALQARSFIAALRLFARKAMATLRHKLERYFGQKLIRAVETRLRRLLGAKAPTFATAAKGSRLGGALGPAGVAATASGVTWMMEHRPAAHPHPPPQPPEEGPRDGKYDLGPPRDPGIPYDDPWPYDPDARPSSGDYALWYKWQALLQGEEAMPGYDEAAATFKHYLDGSGSDYRIDYDKAYHEDKAVREAVDAEIRRAQENAERLYRETGHRDFQMTGEPVKVTDSATKNWEFALGRHSIWGSSDVKVNGDQATMEVTVHAYDRYNFNREDKWINQENGRFETLGWARSYDTYGTLTRTVTWTLPPK